VFVVVSEHVGVSPRPAGRARWPPSAPVGQATLFGLPHRGAGARCAAPRRTRDIRRALRASRSHRLIGRGRWDSPPLRAAMLGLVLAPLDCARCLKEPVGLGTRPGSRVLGDDVLAGAGRRGVSGQVFGAEHQISTAPPWQVTSSHVRIGCRGPRSGRGSGGCRRARRSASLGQYAPGPDGLPGWRAASRPRRWAGQGGDG